MRGKLKVWPPITIVLEFSPLKFKLPLGFAFGRYMFAVYLKSAGIIQERVNLKDQQLL